MVKYLVRWLGRSGAGQSAAALLLGAVVASQFPGRAAAHGDATWIMEHPEYGWCCGPKDCFWLDPHEVRDDDTDYVVDRFSIRWPKIASFPSNDRRYWACYFMPGTSYQQLKCFFAPAPTT